MDERLRELLNYFAQSMYNVIVMYHPQYKESTQRIIAYRSYTIPGHGVFSYRVDGKDITKLIENLKLNNSISPIQPDLAITNQIDVIANLTYEFSSDYAFEMIRA
jgi:hypothetical protein